jgi:hypothetical protein
MGADTGVELDRLCGDSETRSGGAMSRYQKTSW